MTANGDEHFGVMRRSKIGCGEDLHNAVTTLKTTVGYALSRWIVWAIRKWTKDLKRYFTKEDPQMAQKPMNRCSAPLAISEMQIKTVQITAYQ